MAKLKRRKCRIKLNDILNERLDSLEDNSSLEVFEPKNSAQMEFLKLVDEALEEEDNLKYTEKTGQKKKKRRSRNKGNVRISQVTTEDIQRVPLSVVLILSSLFLLFVYIVWNIIF